jgi:hypothetical protein
VWCEWAARCCSEQFLCAPAYSCTLDVDGAQCDVVLPMLHCQDSVHVGTKLRNRLLREDSAMYIGNYRVSYDYLRHVLQANRMEEVNRLGGLRLSDVMPSCDRYGSPLAAACADEHRVRARCISLGCAG